jgi:hypothetical protein
MQEQLPLNQHPLNQLAKEKLQQVKEYPDPHRLYIQQLLTWALDSETLKTEPEIEDKIGQMQMWKPETWMNEVTNLYQEEGVPIWLEDKSISPKDLAWKLLDRIESLSREQTS